MQVGLSALAAQLAAVGALTGDEEAACSYAVAGAHRLPVPWVRYVLMQHDIC
jgi:hypothetical protein